MTNIPTTAREVYDVTGAGDTVIATLTLALASGATLVKPPQKVFWGGYSGYFSDPDGHLWEVAHNPFFPLSEEGLIRLP